MIGRKSNDDTDTVLIFGLDKCQETVYEIPAASTLGLKIEVLISQKLSKPTEQEVYYSKATMYISAGQTSILQVHRRYQ